MYGDGLQRVASGKATIAEAFGPTAKIGTHAMLVAHANTEEGFISLGVPARLFIAQVTGLAAKITQQHVQDPQRSAGRLTGWLLGKGTYWFRDFVRDLPKAWIPHRKRFASDAAIVKARAHSPPAYDRLTANERVFMKLDPAARSAIEQAVRRLVEEPCQAGTCTDHERFLLTSNAAAAAARAPCSPCATRRYFEMALRPTASIAKTPFLIELHRVVWAAIRALPTRIERGVRTTCRRPLRSSTGAIRKNGSPRNTYYLLPLPVLGPPIRVPRR